MYRYSAKYNTDKLVAGYTGKFVVQIHNATNKHYDFRLEFPNGKSKVFRSWALPKHKIPQKIGDKVLAVETEDHILGYGDVVDWEETYEIPEGEYGAGSVELYDRGQFVLIDVEYDKKYVFKLVGSLLNGVWSLVKTDGTSFLLVKSKANQPEMEDPKIEEAVEKISRALF
jgi:DNA ligase D-like protein (predicted 3'-phosphoesterase)